MSCHHGARNGLNDHTVPYLVVSLASAVVGEGCDQFGRRFSRNAFNPSWPSADTRRAAIALAVIGVASSAVRPQSLGISAFAAATASGPAERMTVAAYVADILSAGPEAVAAAKALIPSVWGRTADEATPITANAIAARRVSAEGQEGLKAFLEKRRPNWSQPSPTTADAKDTTR